MFTLGAAGENEAVTPAGSPLAERVTTPVNPLVDVMATVLVPLVPAVIVTLDG